MKYWNFRPNFDQFQYKREVLTTATKSKHKQQIPREVETYKYKLNKNLSVSLNNIMNKKFQVRRVVYCGEIRGEYNRV